jgi:quinol monooxygenase YgiN
MLDPVQVLAVLIAKPGQENALATLLQGLVAPTRAEQGVLFYDLHQDREDPARFVFFEGWASQAALDAHNASPHLLALQEQLPALLAQGDVRKLKKIA